MTQENETAKKIQTYIGILIGSVTLMSILVTGIITWSNVKRETKENVKRLDTIEQEMEKMRDQYIQKEYFQHELKRLESSLIEKINHNQEVTNTKLDMLLEIKKNKSEV